MPSKESISNITISEASTVFKVLIIPITSRKLLLVLLFLLTPGVSTILKSYPNFFIGILIQSLVVPGLFSVICFPLPNKKFTSVDFPTFGFPKIDILGFFKSF